VNFVTTGANTGYYENAENPYANLIDSFSKIVNKKGATISYVEEKANGESHLKAVRKPGTFMKRNETVPILPDRSSLVTTNAPSMQKAKEEIRNQVQNVRQSVKIAEEHDIKKYREKYEDIIKDQRGSAIDLRRKLKVDSIASLLVHNQSSIVEEEDNEIGKPRQRGRKISAQRREAQKKQNSNSAEKARETNLQEVYNLIVVKKRNLNTNNGETKELLDKVKKISTFETYRNRHVDDHSAIISYNEAVKRRVMASMDKVYQILIHLLNYQPILFFSSRCDRKDCVSS
jgi:hypothetical protein